MDFHIKERIGAELNVDGFLKPLAYVLDWTQKVIEVVMEVVSAVSPHQIARTALDSGKLPLNVWTLWSLQNADNENDKRKG